MAITAGAIKAGEAFVRLFADDSALRRTLDQSSKRLRAFGTAVAAAGAGIVGLGVGALGGLAAAGKSFSEYGAEIDDINKRTGLSIQALAELEYVARKEGSTFSDLTAGLRKYNDMVGSAIRGGGAATKTLEGLGLSVEALAGMNADDRLRAAADAIAAVEDEAERTTIAMDLFGIAGQNMIPIFRDGAAGLEALRREARELGITLSNEDAQAAAELDDAFVALGMTLTQVWRMIGASLAPALTELLGIITPIVSGVTRWIDENRGMIIAAAQAAAALTALGAVLIGIGGAIVVFGVGIGLISTAMGAIAATVGFLISPLGLTLGLLTGIIGVSAGIAAETGKLSEALDWLGQQFRTLGSIASETFAGIADALAYGDIELAGQILWAGLEAAWVAGTNTLKEVWLGVKTYLLTKAYEIWAGIQLVWNDLAWGLSDAIDAAIDTVMDSWTKLQASMLKAWHTTTGSFADLMLDAWGVIDKDFDADAAKEIRRTNDAATVQAIDSRRDRTLDDRTEQRRNLELEKESRRKGEEAEILAELAAAELKLAEANAASRAQAEAELALAQARLDMLRAEAGLRRSMVDEGRRQIEDQEDVKRGSKDKLGFADFAGRAITSFRPDSSVVRAAERTAKATENTEKNTGNLVSIMRDVQNSLTFA